MGGWWRRLLRVNLAAGTAVEEEIPGEELRAVIGGRGLGVSIVSREVSAGVDPLGPDNRVVVATGPLTGTRAPTAGRSALVTVSPLTGAIHDSNAGGRFGTGLKRAGFDAIVVEGVATAPVALVVSGGQARLIDAGEWWGRTADEVSGWLKSVAGSGVVGTACIGPAGVNGSRIAAVIVDGKRAFARGGVGAVLGSRNLLGIAVSGTRTPSIADPERFEFACYEASKLLTANPITARALPLFGTSVLVNLMNELGILPVRNFTGSMLPGAANVSGEELRRRYLVRRSACHGCAIACGRVVRWDGREQAGPEYESIWALGPNCGIDRLEPVIAGNLLCNGLGLDTISAGGTIALAMELAQEIGEGVQFGDERGMLQLLEGMAHRTGEGAALADGSRAYGLELGAGDRAMQVRGLELPAYDPRGMQGQGLALATSNRGGCHLRANMLGPEVVGTPKLVDRFSHEGRAGLVIVLQHGHAVVDSLVTCKFAGFALGDEHWARLLSAATGVDYTSQDLQRVGERIWHLERVFNLKRGGETAVDTLPYRLTGEPLADGPGAGQVVRLSEMLSEYYRFRGWEADGAPSGVRLRQLGIGGGGGR